MLREKRHIGYTDGCTKYFMEVTLGLEVSATGCSQNIARFLKVKTIDWTCE